MDHLSKYLAMRLTLDLDAELPEAYRLLNFCIYVAPSPGQFVPLAGSQTLRQINDKFWKVNKLYFFWNCYLKIFCFKYISVIIFDNLLLFFQVNKPLEMYYSWKKT